MRIKHVLSAAALLIAIFGLSHTASACYNPALGRWMEQDPSGYIDGMNLYLNEAADPIARLDPSGLTPYTCQKTGVQVLDTKWRYLGTVPGNLVGMSGSGVGNAPVTVSMAYFRGVYYKMIYEQIKCCDCSDSPYFGWRQNVLVGTADASGMQDTANVITASVPIVIPGWGNATGTGFDLTNLVGLTSVSWAPGANTNWPGRPAAPNNIIGSPTLNINDPNHPNFTLLTPPATVTCKGPFIPWPIPAPPPFPP